MTWAAAAALWLGCGDGEEGRYELPTPVPVTGEPSPIRGVLPEDERDPPPGDLDWQRCSLISDSGSEDAECATISVPVRWEEPSGDEIELFVKRTRFVPRPRGQLWLLSGGPGSPGKAFEGQILDNPATTIYPSFEEVAPDLEVYLLDHRGTGRSSRLGCAEQEAPEGPGGTAIVRREWGACRAAVSAEWGDRLAGFSLTEAARDLGELVERTRHGEEPVFVYGVSYGTTWAQRYLSLYPEQASGVILDSICAPGACDFGRGFDAGYDRVAQQLLQLCGEDPACVRALGPDPWATLGEVHADIAGGACPDARLTPSELRRMLSQLLAVWPLRDMIPAAIERVRDCDVPAIEALRDVVSGIGVVTPDDLYSPVLFQHVVQSELVAEPVPTEDEALAFVDTLRVAPEISPTIAFVNELDWPAPPRDPVAMEPADTDVPLLMMNGTLDPQTPIEHARALELAYPRPGQVFVTVPRAGHSVFRQSPTALEPDGTLHTCGQELVTSFLADPARALDTSCTEEVVDVVFEDPELAQLLFGSPTSGEPDGSAVGAMRAVVRSPHGARQVATHEAVPSTAGESQANGR